MIKFFLYIIFIISLENAFVESTTNCIATGTSVKDCSQRLTENEKNDGYYCCLFTGTRKDNEIQDNQCMKLNEDEQKNIDDKIDEKKTLMKNLQLIVNLFIYIQV